ncbi:hypothetical protein [Aureimonas glaciei]|jgi:uncharacterized membrane protein YdcZ (DUF606 family)|uniref:Uncharacterized protein n=1 Tax=Aureimonas glaciei TaxID=1776957 RepID=A0A916XU98_9HYPH|nr:hypothetical protein [Aureimonas glaciei]GGD10981.1 hypothetical protein GCM10011335_12400 [Aureimonas glaciei]
MSLSKRDRTVAVSLIVGAIVAALLVYGLFTDWFGIYGVEQKPDGEAVETTSGGG